MTKMLVAKEGFVKEIDGAPRQFIAGETRLLEGHPWLRGIEHLFEPMRETYEVEAATAGPGEKRGQ